MTYFVSPANRHYNIVCRLCSWCHLLFIIRAHEAPSSNNIINTTLLAWESVLMPSITRIHNYQTSPSANGDDHFIHHHTVNFEFVMNSWTMSSSPHPDVRPSARRQLLQLHHQQNPDRRCSSASPAPTRTHRQQNMILLFDIAPSMYTPFGPYFAYKYSPPFQCNSDSAPGFTPLEVPPSYSCWT